MCVRARARVFVCVFDSVGHMMSTKYPDGKPHSENLSWDNWSKPNLRLDLTDTYKFPEGEILLNDL